MSTSNLTSSANTTKSSDYCKVQKSNILNIKPRCCNDELSSSDEDNSEDLKNNLRNSLSSSENEETYDSDITTDTDRIQEKDAEIRLIIEALDSQSDRSPKYYNKSFSDDKLREIERSNTLLMNKILSNNIRKNQYATVNTPHNKVTSNSINRKKKQREIDYNNLHLLKRIQSIKPFGLSHRKN